jgi:hypothetical protein
LRVWDIDPRKLCRRHLLAQHNEIHGIWSIIVNERRGYAHHPETNRWRGRLGALHVRHAATAGELIERGFRHNSPLPDAPLADACEQPLLLETIEEQIRLLRSKACGCDV